MTPEKLEQMKSLVGCIVEMTGIMEDEALPLAVGDRGPVTRVESPNGLMWVKWESGRTLRLLARDPFKVVSAGVGAKIKRVLTGQEYTLTKLNETAFVAEQLTDWGMIYWRGKAEELIMNVTYKVVY